MTASEKPGYGEITGALAAGRTSIVTDPSFEREFYRLAGFRFLGKRAVRIDILERLADIIRPLLQWKPDTGPRPDGAYDGRRFVTTPAMLSILGATPDDIEEILKGLGYRADEASAEEVAAHCADLDAKVAESAGKSGEDAPKTPDAEPEKSGESEPVKVEQPKTDLCEPAEAKQDDKPAEAEDKAVAETAADATGAAESAGCCRSGRNRRNQQHCRSGRNCRNHRHRGICRRRRIAPRRPTPKRTKRPPSRRNRFSCGARPAVPTAIAGAAGNSSTSRAPGAARTAAISATANAVGTRARPASRESRTNPARTAAFRRVRRAATSPSIRIHRSRNWLH